MLHGLNICKGENMTELESHKNTTQDLELDDLLISNNEGDESKSGNSKKLILLSAIGVLVFAVVVLIVYLLQGDSHDSNPTAQSPETQKPLESLGSQNTQTSNTSQQNTDFGQVPIQNNTSSDDQFQMIINQIKAQQNQANASSQSLPTVPTTPKAESSKPAQQQANLPQTNQKSEKQEVAKPSARDNFKDVKVNDPSLQGSEATRGFYIQVGSFSKFSPNKQLIGTINEGKYSYRMQKSGDNNRLLIGPYGTKQEAQDILSEIRSKINKDAFIKEIK